MINEAISNFSTYDFTRSMKFADYHMNLRKYMNDVNRPKSKGVVVTDEWYCHVLIFRCRKWSTEYRTVCRNISNEMSALAADAHVDANNVITRLQDIATEIEPDAEKAMAFTQKAKKGERPPRASVDRTQEKICFAFQTNSCTRKKCKFTHKMDPTWKHREKENLNKHKKNKKTSIISEDVSSGKNTGK